MTELFPKWTNKVPAFLALGAGGAGLFVVFVVYFWFSPKNTDVGYQPYQPIPYSHKLHAGTLGMDCRYCHRTVIGDKNQVDQFTESLMECFLTEDEILRWQSGETFPDPWPDNYVTRSH